MLTAQLCRALNNIVVKLSVTRSPIHLRRVTVKSRLFLNAFARGEAARRCLDQIAWR